MNGPAAMFEEMVESTEFLGYFMLIYLGMILLSNLVGIALYVMQSLGLYTISKRRGIHNPWLAWIPLAYLWILGSISDQYQYVTKGKVKNRRKTLIALQIVMVLTVVLMIVALFVIAFTSGGFERMPGSDISGFPGMGGLLLMIAAYLAMIAACIAVTIFRYIAFYDTFASCNPDIAPVFLVLGIFFPITLPVFVFALRKRDGGMPPRRVQPITPPAPQYQPPIQPMVEPVVTAEPVVEFAPVEDTSFCAEPEDFEE